MKRQLTLASSILWATPLMLLASAAPSGATQGFDAATGEISAGRNDTLTCTGINRSGSSSNLFVALKNPLTGANLPAGSNSCNATPDNVACSVAIKHNSPIPLVAYCHVSSNDPEFSGNLRRDNPNGVSEASSDLQHEENLNGV